MKPAVRITSAQTIVRRSPTRSAMAPPTTPPENCTREATARTTPTVPRPMPSRSCRKTDMNGSTMKLPSGMRKELKRRKRSGPLSVASVCRSPGGRCVCSSGTRHLGSAPDGAGRCLGDDPDAVRRRDRVVRGEFGGLPSA